MKLYGEISKTEEQADGTLKIWGIASSATVDSDGEIVTAEAMKAALPDYMKWGAVREMHKRDSAAGTTTEISVDDEGRTNFSAVIADDSAIKKLKANVYKGVSIGGKVTSRDDLNKNIITGLRLIELSLVDRPANPEATITIVKIDNDEDHDLKKYAGEQISDASAALDALGAVFYLYSKEVSETAENPDQVEALKSVIDNLKAFIASEIKEPDNSADSSLIAYAATTDDLNKSGAEISAKNKEKMQQIHDHAVSMGASCSQAEKAEEAEDLLKMQSENHDLRKQFQDLDTKYADLKKSLHDTTLELELIKAEPAPAKMSLNDKGVTVTKTEDGGADSSLDDEVFVKDSKGNINEAATLIKLSHMSGGLTRR